MSSHVTLVMLTSAIAWMADSTTSRAWDPKLEHRKAAQGAPEHRWRCYLYLFHCQLPASFVSYIQSLLLLLDEDECEQKEGYLCRLFQNKKYQKLKENINHRIKSVPWAFERLSSWVFNNHEQKPMMFCTVVIFNLLYTCETWTLYRKRPRKFQHFQEAKFKQMAGLTHQQRSPQSLKNTKHWSHYPQTSPQVVRCHSNGPFKTPADHPLQWTHQRHTRSPKRRFNDQLKSFLLQAGISRNLGNRSHQSSIQTTSNSFRLFHQKKGERCKRKKIEGNAMLSSSDQDYHPPYYAM